jgi:ketosteroid isomerase-like protein
MSEPDKDIQRMLAAYQAAVLQKDVAGLMRLYDPAVRVFDAWGVWAYQGAAAWQRAVEGWFTSLGTGRVQVSFAEVQAQSGKDLAWVSAVVCYAGQSADGQPLGEMHNRITWVMKTSGHVPRIVHEHTSAPIGFDDKLAILQREAPG